jgi:hypothetical protein
MDPAGHCLHRIGNHETFAPKGLLTDLTDRTSTIRKSERRTTLSSRRKQHAAPTIKATGMASARAAPLFWGGGVSSVFLLYQFFQTIPEDLADAASAVQISYSSPHA